MAMGRIEHTLLDEGRASSPTDLRPSLTAPYHKKCRMFLSTTKGQSPALKLGPRPGCPGDYSSSMKVISTLAL
jgi:hypothetical protein